MSGAASIAVAALQQPSVPQPNVVEIDKLKDNLYVMKGGGGNSSVKGTVDDLTGQTIETLWIKGSGADMAEVQRAG